MAQYVLINPVGTRFAGEVLDSVQDGQAVIDQLVAFGGVLVPLPNALLQPYIDRAQQLVRVGNYDEATAMMQAAYASSTAISGGGTTGTIPIWSSASGLGDSAITEMSGAIQTLTLTNAGAGATNGTYTQQALTGGTGSGATADIVVSGNVVTVLALRSPGTSYTVGNTLSCATIGGAGFVFTVSAVSASDNASGNVTALRVGAGTATPVAELEANGLSYFRGIGSVPFLTSSGTYSGNSLTSMYVTSVSPSGVTQTFTGANYDALTVKGRYSTTDANRVVNAVNAQIFLEQCGTPFQATGITATAFINSSLVTGVTATFYGGFFNSGFSTNAGAGNTVASQFGVYARVFASATTAVAHTNVYGLFVNPNYSGAAHTVSNLYGLHIGAAQLSGGATITNRWGVYAIDPASRNAFYGNLGVGNALDVGAGKVIGSLTLTNGGTGYTNNSYQQVALTTVTGTGSGATADIIVTGGIVTSVVLRNPGQGYAVSDTLSCASIGAGSNFLLTVATTASILRSDGTAVASRIGAGTAAPVAAMDAVGGSIVRSSFLYNYNYNSGTNFQIRAHLGIDSSAEPSGATVLASTDSGPTGIVCRPIYDATAITGNVTANGISVLPQISAPSGGTVGLTGFAVSPQVTAIGMTGKTVSIVGVSSGGQINNQGAGNTASLTAFSGAAGVFSSTATIAITALTQVTAGGSVSGTAHTVTDFHWYRGTGSTFNNGVVVTNFYGLRLGTPTLAGGATITNRWGVSQEDAAANNVFAGKTAAGQAAGTAATALVDVGAATTATASLRIRSSAGTAPTAPNDGDIWFDGTNLKIRIGGVTKTFTVV